jgi:hypothetical protein
VKNPLVIFVSVRAPVDVRDPQKSCYAPFLGHFGEFVGELRVDSFTEAKKCAGSGRFFLFSLAILWIKERMAVSLGIR